MRLIDQLKKDFPAIKFISGEDFFWDFGTKTITWGTGGKKNALVGLHELAHAVLGHKDYEFDVELLKMEAEAWEHVKTVLAPKYKIKFIDDTAQGYMESYREWLHGRSKCPKCTYNGWQTEENKYKCPNCLAVWKVNSDKFKHIYRQILSNNKHP